MCMLQHLISLFHIILINSMSDSVICSEERRKQAMKQLIQTLPDNYDEIAESSLKTMLGVLLLTSGGTDVS